MDNNYVSEPRLILDCRNRLGESIVWDDRESVLFWTNIHDGEVWAWDPNSDDPPRVHSLQERVGALGLRSGGGLVVALEKGFGLIDPASGELERIASLPQSSATVRLNDGRIDPAGRFVCGGMDEGSPQRPIANLYSLGKDHAVSCLLSGISCANSLSWSLDGHTMYFTDMPTRRIEAFDYDIATGQGSNRRIFADLSGEPGLPDGSLVDAEGCLWNAQWQGSKLVRYRPDGSIDREVILPVSNPTCMAFGGPDLDVLFITSAWFGLDSQQRSKESHAGGVFALRPGVKGRPEHRFGG